MGVRKYTAAVVATAAVIALLHLLHAHVNLTTVALAFVLLVMMSAVWAGSGPALLVSLLALLGFNYFFIPPVGTWSIADPRNWVAFGAFLITALVVGQLSSRARRKADEAEARRLQIEQLYEQLRKAFAEAAEAESLRKSEQLKTALLDAITHDLRTPLTSIKASATALLGDNAHGLSEEAQQELLAVINEESDKLDRFVEEMMSLAQIEGGQLPLHRSAVPAQEIISAALDRAEAHLRAVPVEITIAPELPPLLVDAAAFSGAVYEVVENAAKYAPRGSSIRISAERADDGAIEIAVQDDGPGVPENLRTHVFEKFFRAPGVPRDKQGFGMGLAIARGIVEAHGGAIRLESGPAGRGTVVRFTAPAGSAAHG